MAEDNLNDGSRSKRTSDMYAGDIPVLSELASLIGSLDIDTPAKLRGSRYSDKAVAEELAQGRVKGPSNDDMRSALTDMSSINLLDGSTSNVLKMKGSLQSVTPFGLEQHVINDQDEHSVVRYGTQCSLRGRVGRYLCGVPVTAREQITSKDLTPEELSILNRSRLLKTATFLLGSEGQGIGDSLDSLIFINPDNSDHKGPVKYGDVVAIKSPGCRHRYLGVRDGKLGFWRAVIGQPERWVILKGSTKGLEDASARGYFMRCGDGTILQTLTGELYLSLMEISSGHSVRLVHKDRAWACNELWQVQWFGAEPSPYWLAQRPYLSGRFLAMVPQDRLPNAEVEGRTFPGALPTRFPEINPVPLKTLPEEEQELCLIRDIVSCMSGVEGVYIRTTQPASEPTMVPSFGGDGSSGRGTKLPFQEVGLVLDLDIADRSIANQVTVLLPLCENAIKIRQFIRMHSRYEFGCISQSFAAAVKALLKEFDVLTAQVEALFKTGQLVSIQKLFYLIQPAASTLRILNRLVMRISDKTGGALVDELQTCLQEQGDEKLRKMYVSILQQTSVPFLRMLSDWIFRGEVNDRNAEFMVQENTSFQREALAEDITARFWEGRYTLRRAHIPKMFRLHAEKILAAGKYLNILRDCSTDTAESNALLPPKRNLSLDLDGGSSLLRIIEEAHLCSSRLLLRILLDKHHLISHLTSLRRFMLLEYGDFFVQFMDMAESDLRQEVQLITVGSVQLLLQGAVHSSSLASDPHKEDFECTLASLNLIQHLHKIQTAGTSDSVTGNPLMGTDGVPTQGLKGVEALTFEYRVKWPVSIVLSKRIITKYQLLSRLLFFCKHVELRVLGCWREHQQSKELRGVRKDLGPSHCLRHRMLHFLQNFVYYMTVEVIAPRSHQLAEDLDRAQDIDEVLVVHEKFLDICLKESLLNSQELLRILTKLTTTCLLFADQMNRFAASADTFDKNSLASGFVSGATSREKRIELQEDFMRHEVSHDAYIRMISKFSDTFDTQLGDFLEMLWNDSNRHHPQLSNLCVRLDYNGFYTERFASDGNLN